MHIIEAKNGMQKLATQAKAIVDDPRMTNAVKLRKLGELEPQMKAYQDVIAIHDRALGLATGGSSIDSWEGGSAAVKSGRAPRLTLNDDQKRQLFEAVRTKQPLRMEITTKSPMDAIGLLPAQLAPGIVALAHEPVRLLDHIPASPMSGPSIEFLAHTATTGAPGMVAPGGTKPEVEFTLTPSTLTARKIAGWASLLDENLMDFPAFQAYIENELVRVVTDVENDQILNGDGTGENLLGLFSQVGILTRDHTADVAADATATGLDTLEMAFTDLRTGPAFIDPDAVVMHPTTWSKLRRTKDSYGRYILSADPASNEANSLWGVPVLATTTCPVGSALVANLEQGAQAFVRQGFTIETSNQAGDAFTTNKTLFRAEERLTIGSQRPKALLAVSHL